MTPAETVARDSQHHPDCFQVRPQGIPTDLPSDLCDCRVIRMIEDWPGGAT